MRRIFTFAVMLCCLLISSIAGAAQITDAKWGVDAENVVRLVVDATEPVDYTVENGGNTLTLTVNAPYKGSINKTEKIRSTLAPSMQTVSVDDRTVIKVHLSRTLTDAEYKSFTLKKDPKTNRPYRVVLDITGDKKAAVSTAGKTAASGTVVSSKPVVGNKPVSGNTSAAVKKTESKPVVSNESKTEKKQEEKKTTAPAAVKGSGKFETDGGLKGKVITLDPGHGGSDPGAIGADGTREKDVTLDIAKKLEALLKKEGAKVYMTRTTDKDVCGPYAKDADELQARVNVAEKYNSDLFISLHINSSVNKKIGGFSSYYYPKTKYDLKIAKAIQNQLTSNFGVDDLGVREANFYVVKRCSMPATLLELCFISNPKEEKLMNSNWFKNKTAKMIAEGIEEYFK